MANVIRIGGGGGGQNLTLPPMVTNLAASTGDQSITLTWTNPDSDALAGVLIVYNSEHVPEKISDGTKVDAGLVETYELTGLTNETLYYIRVFPYNSKKQYQTMLEGATITATPDDFPAEPTSWIEIETLSDSESWVVPENGWFKFVCAAKCGNGGRSAVKWDGGYPDAIPPHEYWGNSGAAGGGGGYSETKVSKFKDKIIEVAFSNGAIYCLGVSVTAGGNGTDNPNLSNRPGGAGGMAIGGNITNINGEAGAPGVNGNHHIGSSSGISMAATQGGLRGDGQRGGNGAGITNGNHNSPAAGVGAAAYVKIYRGNTNVPSPSAASTLSLTPRNASIEASWTNSEDPESVGTLLVSNPTHEPQDITDGTAVDVAEATSYTLTNLPNDKPTYISLFSYNADKSKYSAAKSDVEIPRKVTWADTVEEAQQEAKEATDKAAVAEEQAKQANETLQAKIEELAQTSAELTEKQVMVDSATATFNALIASDIQNDTKVISNNMILDNADMLSKPWEVGTPNEVGDIVWYMIDDVKQYYEVVRPTENADPNHTPNIVPAVFVAINKTNAGTIDDPIPAVRGMKYEYGKYYLDNEDGKIYICKRGEETGTIVLQYLPHELIGHYFELATLTE